MTNKRAAAYIRVSSEEQTDGWSLQGQEQQIREYADKHGYEIVQVYQDETSGSKDKRQGLERMLMDAHSGLFRAIIVIHTSRFFRNVSLARHYKDLLRNKLDIDILSVSQPIIDNDDPNAFIMEAFHELFDEYYLHQLRFWTSLGKKTRAQRGLFNGTVPFGYVISEDGVPIPHPKNSDGLKLAYESYATGRFSARGIADLLNREGYRTTGNWGNNLFTVDTVVPMLKNKAYLGFVKYKGELFPGLHPPLISQELFDNVAEIRTERAQRPRGMGETKRIYLFSGIARCSRCGLTLRCQGSSSKNKLRYYRHMAKFRGHECVTIDKGIRADKLEPQWSEVVAGISLPDDWINIIHSLVGDENQRDIILRERDQIQEKLRRLKQLYKDLLIDDKEYRDSYTKSQTKLSSLVLPNSPHLIQAGAQLEKLSSLWGATTEQEKKDITRMMLKSIYVDVDAEQIVSIEPRPVFRLLLAEVCEHIGIEVL